jgi:hypothetical protein
MALESMEVATPGRQRPTPSVADAVSHIVVEEGRDVALAEGRRGPSEDGPSTDGLVRDSMVSRHPPQRVHGQNRSPVAASYSRAKNAGGMSVHNVPLDPQPGSLYATAVDNALKQLQSSDAWLSEHTIKLVQDAIRNALARAGVIRPGVHTVDPLCIGEHGFPAPPMVPRHTMHLIVPLRHTTPYPHWTLALVDTECCRFEWYDPQSLQARTNTVWEGLLSWSNRMNRDKAFDFKVVVSMRYSKCSSNSQSY